MKEKLQQIGSRFAKIRLPKVKLPKLKLFSVLSRLDRYLMKKFIGTYIFSIILIISVAIVFDFNENLAKFSTYGAPWKAIIFDYYANFVPYFANLFSPLFVFISVIFFTSKLAGNSEIIAMLAAGVSFKQLLKPYIISAALIAVVNFYLGSYGNHRLYPAIRQQLEDRLWLLARQVREQEARQSHDGLYHPL